MLSYTRIKTFLTCPKQYFYKYIEGRFPVPTQAILEGKDKHKKISKGEIPEFFKPAFTKNFLNPVFEEKLQYDYLTFELKGVIDCYSINNSIACSIADWKLMALPNSDEQLKLYALLLSKKYPDLEFFTAFFVSIKGGFYKRYTYSKEDIQEFENWLIETADTIQSTKDFPPAPGEHCAYCPFIKDCYKENQLTQDVSTIAITSLDEAIKLAQKVLIAENFLKQVKEQLKNFLIENGLEEIQIDEENRLYLSPTISMRFGKINGRKRKKNN